MPDERFAIIPVYDRAPVGAIAVGSMSAVMEHVVDSSVRNDARRLLKDAASALGVLEQVQEREDAFRERQVRAFCDSVAKLSRRLDAMEAARKEQARKDDRAQRRAMRDYLDSLPDPENPDQDHPTHGPGGELSPVGPVQLRDPGGFDPDDHADASDQIPEPKDPTGTTLEL